MNSAEMFVRLAEGVDRPQDEIEELLRAKLENLPGVLVTLTQPIEMTVDELLEGVRAELAIKIFGEDLDALRGVADDVARTCRCRRPWASSRCSASRSRTGWCWSRT